MSSTEAPKPFPMDISRFEANTNDGFSAKIRNIQRFQEFAGADVKSQPLYLMVSGTSESGKSYMGTRFVNDNIANRLKIYKVLAQLIGNDTVVLPGNVKPNPFDGASIIGAMSSEDQTKIMDSIINRFADITHGFRPISVVETIKHPWMIERIRERTDLQSLAVFIDAPFDKRVERESLKTGKSVEETKTKVELKDSTKTSYGNLAIREMADLEIWNGGDISSYNNYIQNIENALVPVKNPAIKVVEYS